MEFRQLGASGLRVPVVGMGTWRTFDVRGESAQKNTLTIIDNALKHETHLFDTSPMYGAAELVLGETLRGRRSQALIATKLWSPERAEAQVQARRALSLFDNRIDIYLVHNMVNWLEHLAFLEGLHEKGHVRAIGVSHYSSAALPEMRKIMKTGRISVIQIPYNPLERAVERDILPLAADSGIGVMVMRPFAEGALMRKIPSAEKLEPFKAFGVTTWGQILLKWILSDPRCHCSIPATTRAARIAENSVAGSPPWFGVPEREMVACLAGA